MLTPAEASCCAGEHNLLWTSFRRRAIKRNHAVGSGDWETSPPPPLELPQGYALRSLQRGVFLFIKKNRNK